MGERVVIASGNQGKLREFGDLLANLNLEAVAQSHFNVIEPEETGLTFVENAIIKARNAAKATGLPAIADDSGLEVDYLNGAPGIYSSRFSGPDATDEANNLKLLTSLDGVPESRRSARFQCLLVFMRHSEDPTPIICQGSWEGRIAESLDGSNGFGYDPLFFIPELGCTSAALGKSEKNRLSHRAKAMQQLLERLEQ